MNKESIVVWEKNPYMMIHNDIYIDTLGKEPYSNPVLKHTFLIDSVLGTYTFEMLNEAAIDSLGEFQFSKMRSTEILEMKVFKGSIYHQDWPWNHIFLYSEKYGTIAFYPGHSGHKYFLRKKLVEGKIKIELDDWTINSLTKDLTLNPVPPIPKEVEVIEVIE